MDKVYYIKLYLLIICTACNFIDREIDIELPEHRSRIVLNSVAKAGDEQIRLSITRSLGMKDTASIADPLRNITIEYKVNDQPVYGFLLDTLGDYVVDYPIRSGDRLEIAVSAEGYDPISSQTIVPNAAELISARFGRVIYGFDGIIEREVLFHMKDIPGEINFYKIGFIQMQSNEPRVLPVQLSSLIPWVAPFGQINLAFDDTSFQDRELEGQALIGEYAYNRHNMDFESYFILETVDQTYYDYSTTYYYHRLSQQPDIFTGEAVPMSTNVKGGFGVFSSAAAVRFKID